MSSAARLVNRVRGCLIGGVIGDALGGPFEGQPGPLEFVAQTAWSISDDSQLTLATCESIRPQAESHPSTSLSVLWIGLEHAG